jgi:hypothetical protein
VCGVRPVVGGLEAGSHRSGARPGVARGLGRRGSRGGPELRGGSPRASTAGPPGPSRRSRRSRSRPSSESLRSGRRRRRSSGRRGCTGGAAAAAAGAAGRRGTGSHGSRQRGRRGRCFQLDGAQGGRRRDGPGLTPTDQRLVAIRAHREGAGPTGPEKRPRSGGATPGQVPAPRSRWGGVDLSADAALVQLRLEDAMHLEEANPAARSRSTAPPPLPPTPMPPQAPPPPEPVRTRTLPLSSTADCVSRGSSRPTTRSSAAC